MEGTRKIIFLLTVLLLVFPAASVAGDGSGIAKASAKTDKLLGPLSQLVEFYQSYDRLTDENWRSFQQKRLIDIAVKLRPDLAGKIKPFTGKTLNLKRKNPPKGIVNFSSRTSRPEPEPFYRKFFDPAEQKKRGWTEDTFECLISLSSDGSGLAGAGVKVLSLMPYNNGAIARVRVTGRDLEKVASLNGVQRIMPVLKRELNNDLGSQSTGAPRLRLGSTAGWTKGYTGRGVVVGLIDSGIDWTHPDFVDPATGLSRIQYIWEIENDTTYARTPAGMFGGNLIGLDYGTVWTKAEIDGGSCAQYDYNGHGTHTSGTAAGNGHATGLYTGMAPNADIIMVNGLDNNGILFIYEMARQMNKPCAVNMSYGPSLPFHDVSYYPEECPMDPSDLQGQWIDSLHQYYGGGHIPVKSAGNNGSWNTYTDLSGGDYPYKEGGYHWGTTLSGSSSHILNVPDYYDLFYDWFGFYPGLGVVPDLYFGSWFDRPADVTITDPYGDSYPFAFGSFYAYLTYDGNVLLGGINSTPQANGSYVGWFNIIPLYAYYGYSANPVPTEGAWEFAVAPQSAGAGYADFWVADFLEVYGETWAPVDLYTDEIYTTFAGPSSMSNYIVDEGSTPFEITVGAWTTRQGWNSINGHSYTYMEQPWMNTIADFSSPGPARDRFVKPDVAAPGQIILSSLSDHSPYASSPPYITPDGAHMQMSGTSMSAPFVTGGTALILQKYPTAAIPRVRTLIRDWARNDAQTRGIGPSGFGAGKFNLLPLNSYPVAIISADPGEIILDEALDAACSGAQSYDIEDFPLTYQFSLFSKPNGASATLTPSGSGAALKVDPNIEGTYQVGLVVNDGIVDSAMAIASITAKFYPVLPASGFSLQRLESDLIFSKEYVNRLSWQANPENKVTVTGYKLYRKAKGADDSAYQLLQQLAAGVLSYDDRGLAADQLYTYKLTTIDQKGRESDPAVAGN